MLVGLAKTDHFWVQQANNSAIGIAILVEHLENHSRKLSLKMNVMETNNNLRTNTKQYKLNICGFVK